jgi:hypothetical protein
VRVVGIDNKRYGLADITRGGFPDHSLGFLNLTSQQSIIKNAAAPKGPAF